VTPSQPFVVDLSPPRRRAFARRRSNRRQVVQRRAPIVALADGLRATGRTIGRALRVAGRVVLLVGLVGGVGWGVKVGHARVVASPRFAVAEVRVAGNQRIPSTELTALSGVAQGDQLLALDTGAIARSVSEHPWVASARVRRQLPATLLVEVTERRAAGVVALGGLYLIDDLGRPFKRATMEEAEGLPILSGISREVYSDHRDAAEAAHREGLGVVAAWQARPMRPAISEMAMDPRHGFTAYLLDGGAEIRLGRGELPRKLDELDRILSALARSGDLPRLRVVHLDGATPGRVPVRLEPEAPPAPASGPARHGGALATPVLTATTPAHKP
jgi:cell division protein FtsQ